VGGGGGGGGGPPMVIFFHQGQTETPPIMNHVACVTATTA
jgi:hypothetical protein